MFFLADAFFLVMTSPLMVTYSNQRMFGMQEVSLIIRYSDILHRSML